MIRFSTLSLAGVFLTSALAQAQVVVRVPFVRVQVGGPGVAVRAPFVNLFVPSSNPVYVPPPIYFTPIAPLELAPPPAAFPPGAPLEIAPPAEVPPVVGALPAGVPTLEEFARGFQPKAGMYDVTLLNPLTRQPTRVRFTLPEGQPRRVHVNRRNLEFDYGPRQFVRIEFDREGAQVVAR